MSINRNDLRVFGVMALAACAAACGALPALAPAPAPANYAALAAAYFSTLPAKPALAGALISAVRPAVPPQPADWAACVRLASGAVYAVFYGDGAVTLVRSALPVDRCDAAEGYAPLPAPAAAKPAQPPKPAKKNVKQ